MAWNEVFSHDDIRVVWSPPPVNTWKINFDVVIQSSCAFVAAVCRNAERIVLFAWTKSFPPCGPFVGKARVALFAV